MYIPQGILYLPTLALWITLVGAMINREGPVVIVPVGLGAATGVAMAVMNLPWLLVPVVVLWVAGLVVMIRNQRTTAR
ncbi:hypothetical protein ACFS2C_13625 [Prauserella oleivorans]|uniref:Uncharacterized protein n=1 Tax=Prauserella oleivorans TaxID=1478153 RepID=A0ABW5WCY1_9PSEU